MEGAGAVTDDEFADILTPYIGQRLTLKDVDDIIRAVTNRYVDLGYVTTRVYIPSQDVASGVLRLVVVEGVLERLNMDGVGPDDRRLVTAFPGLEGKVLNLRDLEQGLDQMNRLRSNNVTMVLEPGAKAGGSVVALKNQAGRRFHATAAVDNAGSEAVGEVQSVAQVELNDILRVNDLWTVEGRTSLAPDRSRRTSNSLSALLSVPYGYWTATVNGSWFDYRSPLTSLQQTFQTSGTSRQVGGRVERLLHRDGVGKTSLAVGLSVKDNTSYIEDLRLETGSRRLTALTADVRHDRRVGEGVASLSLGYARGLRLFNPEKDREDDGAKPRAQFEKYVADASFRHPLPVTGLDLSWQTTARAQWTRDTLYSSERIGIGGLSSVRGFKEETLGADTGAFLRNDLVLTLPATGWSDFDDLFGRQQARAAYDIGASSATASDTELTSAGDAVLSGQLTAATDMSILAGGTVATTGKAAAAGTLTVHGNGVRLAGTRVDTDGMVVSDGAVTLDGAAVVTAGAVHSAGLLTLEAGLGGIDNAGDLLGAGGLSIVSGGDLVNRLNAALRSPLSWSVTLPGTLANAGTLLSDGGLTIASASLSNRGAISGGTGLGLATSGAWTNSGEVLSGGALALRGDSIANAPNARLASAGMMVMDGRAIDIQGAMVARGGATVEATESLASGGTVAVSGDLALKSAGAAVLAGDLTATGDLSVDAAATMETAGTVIAGGTLRLRASDLGNRGALHGVRGMDVAAAQGLGNLAGGEMVSGGVATISAGADLSSGGTISTAGALNLAAGGTLDSAGQIVSDLDVSLRGTTVTTAGPVHAGGALTIEAGTGGLAIASDGDVVNAIGASMRSPRSWSLAAEGVFTNRGEAISDETLTVDAGSIDNAAEGTLSGAGSITLTGHDGFENVGRAYSGGILSAIGARITNAAGAVLAAVGLISLDADGDLLNGGTITSQGGISLDAGRVASSGVMASGGDGMVIADGGVTVRGSTIAVAGTVHTAGILTLDAGAGGIDNAGDLLGAGGLSVTSDGDLVNQLSAYLRSPESWSVAVSGSLDNSGTLLSDGSLVLTASVLDNSGTVSGGDGLRLTAEGAWSNRGEIVSGGALTAEGATLLNTAAGRLASTGMLTVRGGTVNNAGAMVGVGGLSVHGNTALASSGGMTSGGALAASSGGDATLSGVVEASDGIALTATQTLTNRTGAVTVEGEASSRGTLAVNAAQDVRTLAGGGLSSAGGMTIAAGGDLENSGVLAASGALSITTGGALTNAADATLGSASTLRLTAGGRLTNHGLAYGGGAYVLKAASLVNGLDGRISSSQGGSLDVAGLSNAGSIAAGGSLSATASAVSNTGSITATQGLTFGGVGDFTNTALVFSGADLAVAASGRIFNSEGTILAVGDIRLQGPGGTRAEKIDNVSAAIESLSGNITLSADEVTNKKRVFVTSSGRTWEMSASYGPNPQPGCNTIPGQWISGAGCAYMVYTAAVPHPVQGMDWVSYYGVNSGGWISNWVDTVQASQDFPSGLISAGGNLSINAGALLNDKSHIAAAGDMHLSGDTLPNTGVELGSSWYVRSVSGTMTRCYGGTCVWFRGVGRHGRGPLGGIGTSRPRQSGCPRRLPAAAVAPRCASPAPSSADAGAA